MSLETLLRDAADGDVAFQPDDVHRRVRHWQRRRRALAGLGVVVLLASGAVGVVALTDDNGERSIITGPPEGEPQPVPITEEALVGSRWVMVDPEVATSEVPWITFDENGRWSGSTECNRPEGEWTLTAGDLALVETGGGRDIGCTLRIALTGSTTLTDDGTLRFERITASDTVVASLRRLDQLGSAATTANLPGTWVAPDTGISLGFNSLLEIDGCPLGPWRLEGEGLIFSGSTLTIDCPERTAGEDAATEALIWITTLLDLRVEDNRLWLTNPAATIRLVREGATATEDELVGSPWVVTDIGNEVVVLPRLSFAVGDRGIRFQVDAGCSTWSGPWGVDDREVELDITSRTVGYCTPSQEEARGAGDLPPGLLEGTVALRTGDDGLVLGTGDSAIRFRRFDDWAEVGRSGLLGTWILPGSGTTIVWSERWVEIAGCPLPWSLVGARVRVLAAGCFGDGLEGRNIQVLVSALRGGAGARTEGDDLYLDTGTEVLRLQRANVPAMAPNDAEQMMIDAIADLRLDQCCAEPSHGGDDATVGFTMIGYDILGYAAPLVGSLPPELSDTRTLEIGAVMGEDAEGTVIAFACGGFRITLREFVASGEIPSNVLESAATGLIRALPCSAVPDPG